MDENVNDSVVDLRSQRVGIILAGRESEFVHVWRARACIGLRSVVVAFDSREAPPGRVAVVSPEEASGLLKGLKDPVGARAVLGDPRMARHGASVS